MKMDIPQAAQSEENCEGSYNSIIIIIIIIIISFSFCKMDEIQIENLDGQFLEFQTKEISVDRENILY